MEKGDTKQQKEPNTNADFEKNIINNINFNNAQKRKTVPLTIKDKIQIAYRKFEAEHGKENLKKFYIGLFLQISGFYFGVMAIDKIANYFDSLK